ncbi:Protein of unknown function DUF1963 [Rippkaea orientalis PCC 8801]|uniref:DUF1963 domain-containing protein n=1 Tax=Rippkaea orientalis (strain PCC 8801 / RF-1) TaxID=41431 RepID=B7JY37_RIPO1|nr:YwqG family protein [Rippkaea orientalis]ACK66001.1 Protein of unknown function DUF1963 [Rippkaea orientalis PCC 8801]
MQESLPSIKLPSDLEPIRKQIEATIKPYIEIQPILSKNKLTLWQSKFGGYPYFPKDLNYPKNPDGDPLYLLAQINLAEVPPLEGFPTQGILQFYIDGYHDSYGFDYDDMTNQSHFRVLYFPEIETNEEKLITDFTFLPDIIEAEIIFPFLGSFALTFTKKYEPISGDDYQLEPLLQNYIDSHHLEGQLDVFDLLEDYLDLYDGEKHKLGGYPFFTQDDPRFSLAEGVEPYYLLFQMISDDEADIWWGDAGVGNFFIQPSALAKLDFSRVLYYYDCC